MNYSALDDIALLTYLQEGDENAFAEIYNRYWKRIYGLALNYTRSSEAAQDIVQEVFLKVWINKENLSQIREFRPFLFVSARNLIISTLRNKVFPIPIDPDEQIEEETFLPEKQLSYKESVQLLNKAIELLPAQQQKAWKLSRDKEMRYQDIAREMGISALTVRTHITKALQFIRKYLTDNAAHPVVFLLVLLYKN